MTYVPKKAPPLTLNAADLQNFANYVEQEFVAIGREFGETVALELRVSHREPVKPRTGMLVCADGYDWDPLGVGGGLYIYFDGVWNLVS